MNEILGVIALFNPLTIILVFMIPGVFIALIVSKNIFGKRRKMVGSAAFLILIYFLITGQELIGSNYHEYLCETEAGWKNYSQIKLPSEYWNEDGSPNFVDENGKIQHEKINGFFTASSVTKTEIYSFIKINKKILVFRDKKTNKNLGEIITFMRYFGWTKNYSLDLSPAIGEWCESMFINKYGRETYKKQVKHENNYFILNLFTK